MAMSMMNHSVSEYDVYQKAYEIQNKYPELATKICKDYASYSSISIQYIDLLSAIRGFMRMGIM